MTTRSALVALALAGAVTAAGAQDNVLKFGVTDYTTHSRTDGVRGIGVPPQADARTGNAATLLLVYERRFGPQLGLELALGVPPRIHADAAGSVAFLGKDVLSARNVAPTLLLNYHFGDPGDAWRPYVGAGINYTRFVGVRTKLPGRAELGDSWGGAAQAGIDRAIDKDWGVFASVAVLRVKSKLVVSGPTVLETTLDFRPVVYSFGLARSF